VFSRLNFARVSSREFDNEFFHLFNVPLALESIRAHEIGLELFETLFAMAVSFAASLLIKVAHRLIDFGRVSSSKFIHFVSFQESLKGRDSLNLVVLSDVFVFLSVDVTVDQVSVSVGSGVCCVDRLVLFARRAVGSVTKVANNSSVVFNVGSKHLMGSDVVQLIIDCRSHWGRTSTTSTHASHHLLHFSHVDASSTVTHAHLLSHL